MERADLDQWRAREVARLLALVETQRRYYQEIVASVPVGLMVLSADLRILLANAAARKIFGLQAGDSAQRRMDTLLPPPLLDRVEEVLHTGATVTGILVETSRGKKLRVGILAIRNWDEEAAPEALLSIEDLTEAEIAPAPVVEEAAEVPVEAPAPPLPAVSASDLVDNADAIVWAVELPSMNFVYASPQAGKLLGFAPDHWTSHPSFWSDRIDAADRDWLVQSYQRAIESGAPHSCEFRAITAGGSSVWLREYSRLLPVAEGEQRYMIGVAVDVTERRMLENQLMQAERVEAVARLASRMAHDLNNTLMILTGYSEELLTALPAGSTLRSDVQEIIFATERMSGFTNQLLSFARRQGPPAAEMDLEPAIEKMKARLNALLGTHVGLDLRLSSEHNRILAEAGQLEHVVTAIVERARQGVHAGERITLETSRMDVREDLRLPNAPLQPGSYAVLAFTAPGKPLDHDARAALFECSLPGKEPWDEVAATLSRAYGIVRQWGGDISVSSGPFGAATFRVFLPRVKAEGEVEEAVAVAAVEPAPAPAPAPEAAPLATILVVEDEPGIRALVRKILRRQGYEVLEAANGEDALALCREQDRRIDLLITDVLMPQMGGRELVERLQTQGRKMKVLYVSGYTDDTTIYSGELPPGTAFLQKPFTLGSLLDKVKEVLAK